MQNFENDGINEKVKLGFIPFALLDLFPISSLDYQYSFPYSTPLELRIHSPPIITRVGEDNGVLLKNFVVK